MNYIQIFHTFHINRKLLQPDLTFKGGNEMKKIIMLLLGIMLCTVITGCGGDKFTGKWINQNKSRRIQLDIAKNGENYIITQTTGRYQQSQKMINEKEHNQSLNRFLGYQTYVPAIYDYTFTWTEEVLKLTAVEQKAKLLIDGTMGTDYYVYMDKNAQLMHGQEIYVKEKKDDLAQYQQACHKNIAVEFAQHKNEYDQQLKEKGSGAVIFMAKVRDYKIIDTPKKKATE